MTFEQYECPVCGVGTVRLVPTGQRLNKVRRYKAMRRVSIPENVLVPTCDACGEQFATRDTAKAMDEALEPLFQAELHRRSVEAIDKLATVGQLYRIEVILGLSHGYLSRVRSGKKVPSVALVGLLTTLAEGDPLRNLRAFMASWHGYPLTEREELEAEAIDFLRSRAAAGEIELFEDGRWREEGPFLVVGTIAAVPSTRVLLYTDHEEALGDSSIITAVYVAAGWDEADTVDLVVAAPGGRSLIEEDWPNGLELARMRAKVKAAVEAGIADGERDAGVRSFDAEPPQKNQ